MDFSKSLLLLILIASFSSLLPSANAVRNYDTSVPIPSLSQASAPSPSPSPNTPTASSAVVVDPLLVELCKDGENQSLCIETILPHVQGLVDPRMALNTEIEATKNETEKVVALIVNLLDDSDNSKDLASTLEVCRENYDSIMDNIIETGKALSERDLGTVEVMLSAVISDQQTCDDAFKEAPGVDFPFPDASLAIFQLAANCLAILQFLNY